MIYCLKINNQTQYVVLRTLLSILLLKKILYDKHTVLCYTFLKAYIPNSITYLIYLVGFKRKSMLLFQNKENKAGDFVKIGFCYA